MTRNARLRLAYVANDLIMSFVGVVIFEIIRFHNLPAGIYFSDINVWLFHDLHIIAGMFIFPLMMLALYAVSGYYNSPRIKSRLDDFRNSVTVAFIGTLLIYFIIIVDDYLPDRIDNYALLGTLWLCLALPVMLGRMVITQFQRRALRAAGGCYTAVIIGTPEQASRLAAKLRPRHRRTIPRYRILDQIDIDSSSALMTERIEALAPDAVLVTPHPLGIAATTELINRLYPLGISICITPDIYRLLASRTRLNDVVGEPLIDITNAALPASTANLKRISDIIGSVLALITLSPLMAAVAAAIRIDSRGPVFYTQERIGFHKQPFRIVKFRTMTPHAEPDGPSLSSEFDPRITRVGRFLRKYRLDELPQFWNVLRGDMSLVGPRPERRYYIDRIVTRVPQYSLIHQVRPGITSWGMVKYGYASNVDEMIERLYYDLLYIENVSFGIDMKIIFHTFNTVLTGKGM